MNYDHDAFHAILIFLIFVAFFLGKLRGFRDGRRSADEIRVEESEK